MKFFDYDKNASNVEYYEILEDLMERWEHEIVELKAPTEAERRPSGIYSTTCYRNLLSGVYQKMA